MFKEINSNKLKEVLNYCPCTGLFVWNVKANRNGADIGDHAGNISDKGYLQIGFENKVYKAHRLAFVFMTGRLPAKQVDHINHDTLDNRWKNLREVTNSINQQNRKIEARNTSGVCGVSWSKSSNKWQASIKVNGKGIYLGVHESFEVACTIRKAAEGWYGFHRNHGMILEDLKK